MRKVIPEGTPLRLALTHKERELIADLTLVEKEILDVISSTPGNQKHVMLNLDQLDLLVGSVAADTNHTDDKQFQRKLDRII